MYYLLLMKLRILNLVLAIPVADTCGYVLLFSIKILIFCTHVICVRFSYIQIKTKMLKKKKSGVAVKTQ